MRTASLSSTNANDVTADAMSDRTISEAAEPPVSNPHDRVGIGYTLATGRLFCDIGLFHAYAEGLLFRPVMTHELADPSLWVEMRKRYEALVTEMGTAEYAWLVERGQSENHFPTVWWVEGHSWTEKAHEATRFATRDEAHEQVLRMSAHISRPSSRAVEHGFVTDDSEASSPESSPDE